MVEAPAVTMPVGLEVVVLFTTSGLASHLRVYGMSKSRGQLT